MYRHAPEGIMIDDKGRLQLFDFDSKTDGVGEELHYMWYRQLSAPEMVFTSSPTTRQSISGR